MKRHILQILWSTGAVLLAALFWVEAAAHSQTVAGLINGTVTDPKGNALPGAEVVLKNLDTLAERHANTSATGTYFISAVQPGRYTLTFTKDGFQTYQLSAFTLQVNQNRTMDAQLTLGSVTQVVAVTASALALNMTDATIGTVIQHQTVVDMPLNGRNFTELILLTPGASPVQTGQQSAFTVTGGISPSVNGMRSQMNNFTLDGVDNNMRFSNTYAQSPPPDAIEEFKVASHQTDPAVSVAAGANVNIVTRSGTNDLHGSVWEFLRNNDLDARTYFDNFFMNPNTAYRQNQFGFFLGGPIVIPHVIHGRKSQTYFSTYYEGFRSSQNQVTQATVPDSAERNGDFSELLGPVTGTDCLGRPIQQNQIYDPETAVANPGCPGGVVLNPFLNNIIPPGRINSVAKAYLTSLYPLPNRSGTPNFILSQATTQTGNQYMIRADHNISESQRLFGRVSRYNMNLLSPGDLPANPETSLNSGLNIGINYTKIISPTLLLDALVGYNRATIPLFTSPLSAAFDSAVGDQFYTASSLGNIPVNQSLTGSRFSSGSFLILNLANPDYTYQYNGDLKKVKGRHEMSFGFHYMRFRGIAGSQGSESLTYVPQATGLTAVADTGEALASLYLGVPTDSTNALTPALHQHTNIYTAYWGDTWKVTPTLTFSYGVQYVYAMPSLFDGNRISDFDYQLAETQPDATNFIYAYVWCSTNPVTGAPPNCARPSIISPDRTHFPPRLAVAYSPFRNTVIRAGFGMFFDYNNNIDQSSIGDVNGSWPYSTATVISGQNLAGLGPLSPPLSLTNPFPYQAQSAPAPEFSVNPRNKDPYAEEWNFGIERFLTSNLMLSVDYVGSVGRKLMVAEEDNMARAGLGPINPRRPLHNAGSIYQRQTIGPSSYNALQVKLERSFSGGLTFRNAYTWSKSLDIESDVNAGSARELPYPFDRSFTWGPSDFDISNNNVTSVVYQLPFGRGMKFGSQSSRLVDAVVGGWQSSAIVTLRSGLPVSMFTGQDIANTGASLFGPMEPLNQLAPAVPTGFAQSRQAWFDPSSFGLPSFGTFGNMRSNSLTGPSYKNVDLAFMKNFSITERLKLQFRSELFNAFNHTNFNNPDTTISDPTFAQILSSYPSREIQFALKLLW